jgi:hypothetical protein
VSQFVTDDAADAGPDVAGARTRVSDAVARLDELPRLATAEHVEVFESTQQVLADTLSAVDEA